MNILLVDDHALFRAGFTLMLERLLDTLPCIVEAGSAESGLALAAQQEFDLVFLDLGLPGLDGLEGLKAFRHACPGVCLVVVSATANAEMVRQALLYGAQGYIPKTMSGEAMRGALRQILDGGVFTPEQPPPEAGERLDERLTARQAEVLAELCAGRANKEIADYLGMSENTVRAHVSAIFRQLGVGSRTEAVLLAKRKGVF